MSDLHTTRTSRCRDSVKSFTVRTIPRSIPLFGSSWPAAPGRVNSHVESRLMVSRRWAKFIPPLLTAILASGLGVAINLATEWKRNPLAWLAVVALTLASATAAAAIANRSDQGSRPSGSVESSDKQITSRSGQLSTSGSVMSSGVVMRHVRITPDGSRFEIEYFSEELARVAIRQDLPGVRSMPKVDG